MALATYEPDAPPMSDEMGDYLFNELQRIADTLTENFETLDVPVVPPVDPAPANVFMSGVVSITASGASYTIDSTYDAINVGTVRREITGELNILPTADSAGSKKGVSLVSAVRGFSTTETYIWKVRTFTNTGELLISAHSRTTGLLVDINSFTDTQIIAFVLFTTD